MLQEEHGQKNINLFTSGADRDIQPSLADQKKGFYWDAVNMAIRAKDGNFYSLQTIEGANILFQPAQLLGNNYSGDLTACIGTCYCNNHIIEFFVPLSVFSDVHVPFIMIDGNIVCATSKLGFDDSHYLQIAVNDSCSGGLIALTDNQNIPLEFDVQDMLNNFNSGSQKYFSDFNINDYIAISVIAPDHPVFLGLIGGTLTVGLYTYSLRYVDASGNKTARTVPTPLIPVLYDTAGGSANYNSSKTRGADRTVQSNYGIRLVFRINNLADYDHLELIRVEYDSLSVNGISRSTTLTVDIKSSPANQYKIIIIDDVGSFVWKPVTDDEMLTNSSSIKTCKSLTFHNNRLVLANITLNSLDISNFKDFLTFTYGDTEIPIIEDLGQSANKDPRYATYYKGRFRGEQYQDGLGFLDSYGNTTLIKPLPDSITMPKRRDIVDSTSETPALSNTPVHCGTNHNIYRNGISVPSNTDVADTFECFEVAAGGTKGTNQKITIGVDNHSYNPLTPVNCSSDNVTGEDQIINTYVQAASKVPYNPAGFHVNYKALGTAFKGIDNWNPNYGAFVIKTRERAKKIVAQGIGIYALKPAKVTALGVGISGVYKDRATLKAYFPDMDYNNANYAGFDINNLVNSSRYKIELVSPLGFFSEIYGGDSAGHILHNAYSNSCIDMISYARILYESGYINTGLIGGDKSTYDYYTLYGGWRNVRQGANPAVSTPQYLYTAKSVTPISDTWGDNVAYNIELIDDVLNPALIYDSMYWGGGVSQKKINPNQYRDWHEPFYIINIIDKLATIPTGNSDNYIETGHLQKITALIGIKGQTNTPTNSYPLVDERPEDCIDLGTGKRYVYVDNKAWLDITNLSVPDQNNIMDAIIAGGGTTIISDTDVYGNAKNVTIYGVYKHSSNNTYLNYQIDFNCISTSGKKFIPNNDEKITVRYDNRSPIKLFIGDCYIGENVMCAIDTLAGNGNNSDFAIYAGLPYFNWWFNSNYERIFNAHVTDAQVLLGTNVPFIFDDIDIETVRQWIIMFCCETNAAVPFYFGNDSTTSSFSYKKSFPLINYVQRPAAWDTSIKENYRDTAKHKHEGRISGQYRTDFPNEDTAWMHGGFYYKPYFNPDYQKQNTSQIYPTKPLVDYIEKIKFCTQIRFSDPKPVNAQDNANFKTFPALNIYMLEEEYGEIKYITSIDSGKKGYNIVAITERGIALVFTDKTILSEINANQLATINPDNKFITIHEFITGDIGSNDEMWRGISKYNNQLFIPNYRGIFLTDGVNIVDISKKNKGSYYSKLLPVLKGIKSGYATPITSVYNERDDEYWLQIGNNIIRFDIGGGGGSFPPYINYIPQKNDVIYFYGTSTKYPPVITLPCNLETGDSISIINRSSDALVIIGCNMAAKVIPAYKQGTDTTNNDFTFIKEPTPDGYNFTMNPFINNARCFCYNNRPEIEAWTGNFEYDFEKLMSAYQLNGENEYAVLGIKDGVTYSLNKDTLTLYDYNYYNFTPKDKQGNITFVVSPSKAMGLTKEIINVLINSNVKPDRVEFASGNDLLPECYLDNSISPLYLKDYLGGYYQQVPRKTTPSTATGLRNRLQNDVFFVKVIFPPATISVLKDVLSSYKILK